MRRRAGILAGALGISGALFLLWWLFQPPDTSVPPADLPIPDIDRAPPVPDLTDGEPAERPAQAGWRDIACPLPVVPSSYGWTYVLVEPPGEDPTWAAGTLNSTTLKFMGPAADGVGLVSLPGHERAGLLWYTDANGDIDCYFPRQPERLAHGVLRLPTGERLGPDMHLVVNGMGWPHSKDEDNWLEREVPAGTAEVYVCTSSALYSRSCTEPQSVAIVADQTTTFEPEILPPPDLFVEYQPEPDGILLRYGSEDHVTGMLILAVDDIPTAGMSEQAFLDLINDRTVSQIEIGHPGGVTNTVEFEWPH